MNNMMRILSKNDNNIKTIKNNTILNKDSSLPKPQKPPPPKQPAPKPAPAPVAALVVAPVVAPLVVQQPIPDKPSIIVIGNGPSVLKHNFASLIDSFDIVVRINHYIPSINVGEKVTIFFCSTAKETLYYDKIPHCANQILIWDELNKSSVYDGNPQTKKVDKGPIVTKLHKDFKFNNWPKNPWASTGICALMYLILSNKYDKIHICGFDNLIHGKKRHYFEQSIHDNNHHSTDLERNFITHYIKLGKLCYLIDSDIYKKSNINFNDAHTIKLYEYKRYVLANKITWTLDNKFAISLLKGKCYYCNIKNKINHIDLIDSNKAYITENSVSICSDCKNIKSHIKNIKDFYNICEHISIYTKAFKNNSNWKQNNNSVIKNVDFNLSNDQIDTFLSKKCNLCGNFVILNDDINNKTNNFNCNMCQNMKGKLSNDQFLRKCLMITLKKKGLYFKSDNTDNIELEKETLINLFESKYKKSKIDIDNTKYLEKNIYYEKKTWNGNFESIKNVDLEFEQVETVEQKDLWLYFKNKTASYDFKKENKELENDLLIFLKDKNTQKYLGLIGISLNLIHNKTLGNYIESTDNLKHIINLTTCIPLQPFGFHFKGGKLLAKLIFSKEFMNIFENKYKFKALGVVTSSLYGKSIQYDRLREFKFIDFCKDQDIQIPDELTKKCQLYLMNKGYDFSKEDQFFVVNKALKELKLSAVNYISDIPKGIYFGVYHPQALGFLSCKLNSLDEFELKSNDTIFKDWLFKYGHKRFTHLRHTNRLKLIKDNPILIAYTVANRPKSA